MIKTLKVLRGIFAKIIYKMNGVRQMDDMDLIGVRNGDPSKTGQILTHKSQLGPVHNAAVISKVNFNK